MISFISTPALISFTSSAVMNGMNTSITASPTIKINVSMVGRLNSLTLAIRRFNIESTSFLKNVTLKNN